MLIFDRNAQVETSHEASMTSLSPSQTANHNDYAESREAGHRVDKPNELMIACQRQNVDNIRALLADEEVYNLNSWINKHREKVCLDIIDTVWILGIVTTTGMKVG